MKEKARRRERGKTLDVAESFVQRMPLPSMEEHGNSFKLVKEHRVGLCVSVVLVIASSLLLELGLPVFIVLCIYWMIRNTGQGNKDGLSAYSVFNKNQESLQGSMSAKQFEDELYRKMY